MILSKSSVYALRATLCLADAGDGDSVRVGDVAERLDVPQNYLSKILHVLAREGVLASTRGPRGGFRLAVPPGDLRLTDIVRHFDDIPEGAQCLLGRERCLESDPCAAHEQWRHVGAALRAFLSDTTVADLGSEAGKAMCADVT